VRQRILLSWSKQSRLWPGRSFLATSSGDVPQRCCSMRRPRIPRTRPGVGPRDYGALTEESYAGPWRDRSKHHARWQPLQGCTRARDPRGTGPDCSTVWWPFSAMHYPAAAHHADSAAGTEGHRGHDFADRAAALDVGGRRYSHSTSGMTKVGSDCQTDIFRWSRDGSVGDLVTDVGHRGQMTYCGRSWR